MVCWVVGHHILHPWPLSTSSPTSATVTITLSCHSPCGLPRGTFTVTWCHEDDWGRGLRLQRQRHWGWWSLAGGPCLHSLSLRKPRMKEHHCTHRHIPSTHTCRLADKYFGCTRGQITAIIESIRAWLEVLTCSNYWIKWNKRSVQLSLSGKWLDCFENLITFLKAIHHKLKSSYMNLRKENR